MNFGAIKLEANELLPEEGWLLISAEDVVGGIGGTVFDVDRRTAREILLDAMSIRCETHLRMEDPE